MDREPQYNKGVNYEINYSVGNDRRFDILGDGLS